MHIVVLKDRICYWSMDSGSTDDFCSQDINQPNIISLCLWFVGNLYALPWGSLCPWVGCHFFISKLFFYYFILLGKVKMLSFVFFDFLMFALSDFLCLIFVLFLVLALTTLKPILAASLFFHPIINKYNILCNLSLWLFGTLGKIGLFHIAAYTWNSFIFSQCDVWKVWLLCLFFFPFVVWENYRVWL